MKKSLLILAMLIGGAVTAQDNMTSKKGTPILPEAGDWSIGIGAHTVLEYFGNLMNSGQNMAPRFDWQENSENIIRFKMMKDANTAYRAGLRLGFGSEKQGTGNSTAGTLKDSAVSAMNINLAAGIQMYRGQGRLRGYYGGEAGIGLGSGKTKFTYNGNAGPGETLERKAGGTFSLSLGGFIGAEYFFAPKMSVSGEFGWGLMVSSTGESETKTADGNGGSTNSKGGKASTFRFDTNNANGAIVLNMYF